MVAICALHPSKADYLLNLLLNKSILSHSASTWRHDGLKSMSKQVATLISV